jgi:flavin-dependent dehydrogenase
MEAFIPASEEEIRGRGEQVLEIHVGIVKCGYGWIFPHRGYLSVGLGGEAAGLTNLKEIMERFLATTGFLTGSKARGAPIPAGGIDKSVIADRILLAGDAAGFVDTFSGEGIGFAIRSGQLAAETAFSAIQRGQYSKKDLQVYESRCTREFRGDFKYSLYFTRLFHRFPHYCFRIMTAEPEILRKYIEIPGRRLSYRGFILWLFWRMPLLWWKARRMR